jgi:RimJ/RimL family protein N-acetyltransferase
VAELTLTGSLIRLEPLSHTHAEDLAAAAAEDPALYQWSLVPQGLAAVEAYIEAAANAVAFAIVRQTDNTAIGSTRFFDLARWAWPPDHPRHGRPHPDACEIGYTWLAASAIRTGANTEAKLLMLTHAFETWQALGVCLHTDVRNNRSRAAIERIGGRFDGILRSHRMAADYTPRDSVRYSIVAAEWPDVKARLTALQRP